MIVTRTSFLKYRQLILIVGGIIVLLLGRIEVNAQPHPPRPINVYTIQSMNFGAFSQGFSGGTVIIYPNGSRTATGDIYLLMLGFSYYPAIFEVECNTGTLVTLTNGPDVTLAGSNGGTMNLRIGDSSPASPFISTVAPPGRTQIRVGGILTVGNTGANPVGAYNGSFTIILNQQ
jgi:hypothetical protein